MVGRARCAVGVPNVGPFGDPLLLVDLAVAAEGHGWDGFFLWDPQLWHDQRWQVADPVVVIAAESASSTRRNNSHLVNQLSRRQPGQLAEATGIPHLLFSPTA